MIPGVASNISDNVVTIGSFVAFTCETDSNEHKIVVAECMSNGKFHPDPGSLSCVNGMFLCHTVLENCICKARLQESLMVLHTVYSKSHFKT